MLGPTDVILILIRWVHALAGAVWVGGGLFYMLVLQPSLAAAEDQTPFRPLRASIGKEFREFTELAMMGLAITGIILAFDRLTQGNVSTLYVAILALKVAAATAMLLVTRPFGQRKPRFARSSETHTDGLAVSTPSLLRGRISHSQLILILGLTVFFLASMLQMVFEKAV